MSDTVIRIENLSKLYRLGEVGTGTLSNDLKRWWYLFRGKEDPFLRIGEVNNREKKGNSDYIWALKDINLEVKRGEVLGLIGKNGAGKSTLLKILSKTTAPTTGSISIKGRVASLLEVGTGFHPELTGRENVFLNGAILGMSRAEVKRKFDEIVDFAGVERYIDTPVKRYSSGMYVRLAFAVAAHLEQDILIVDEVLAVGDVEFQKKCLGKMKDVSVNDGRTVLFVSHNMAAVSNLCNRSVLLHNGNVSIDGVTSDVIPSYLKNYRLKLNQELLSRQDRTGIGEIRFSKVSFNVLNHSKVNTLISGADCSLRLHFISIDNLRLFKNCRISVSIANSDSNLILLSTDLVTDKSINITANSIVEFRIKKMPLSKGSYYLTLFLESNHSVQDWIEDAFTLEVEDGDFFGNGRNYPSGWEGKTVLIQHEVKII